MRRRTHSSACAECGPPWAWRWSHFLSPGCFASNVVAPKTTLALALAGAGWKGARAVGGSRYFKFRVRVRLDHRISATDFVRRLGDVLVRVRSLNDSSAIERSRDRVARLVPIPAVSPATAREAFTAWGSSVRRSKVLLIDLKRIGAVDRPPDGSWGS
jgi:hypothetical protein